MSRSTDRERFDKIVALDCAYQYARVATFIKPRTALNGPFPAKINIPKVAQDDTADYEAELSFIIGKDGKDI